MIELDGRMGEGGGQVLRSALSLSAVTGQAFRLTNIRAGRGKPGLLRQHLTCVRAATAVCGGTAVGDTLGSQELLFEPAAVRAGDWRFSIGSAGSASLVLQTIVPPLLLAPGPSTLVVEGGTHNSAAPPFDFLADVFGPHVGLEVELLRWGFYPAGGGELRARVTPGARPVAAMSRGPVVVHAHAATSGISHRLGHRALGVMKHALGLEREQIHFHQVPQPVGPGFACWIEARFAEGREVFTTFGERRVEPEQLAEEALAEFAQWQELDVPVGEHLADQLLLPMAMFGGSMRTGPLSLHARTNIEVIERFLPARFTVDGSLVEVRTLDSPSKGKLDFDG